MLRCWPRAKAVLAKEGAFLLILLLLLTLALSMQWHRLQTPPDPAPLGHWVPLDLLSGRINALIATSADGVPTLYAGTEGGVFTSLDRGATWLARNEGLGNRTVRTLAADPHDGATLYAGTSNGQIYRSLDAGDSWQPATSGAPSSEIIALVVGPHDSRELYAGTAHHMLISHDRGASWDLTGGFSGTLQCLAADPSQPGVLYLGTAGNGIYRSLDRGATWIPVGHTAGITDVTALALVPRAPATIYAIAHGKVYRSEHLGMPWTYADSYRDRSVARSLTINPRNPLEVFVGLNDGLYKSTDGRQSWGRSDAGIAGLDITSLAMDAFDSRVLYAASGHELYVSEDSGASWRPRAPIPRARAPIKAIAYDTTYGQTVYVSALGSGLHSTQDGGTTWHSHVDDLPRTDVTAIALDKRGPEIIYVGFHDGLIMKSVDGGATWPISVAVTTAPINTLVIDPTRPYRVYAASEEGLLYRSDDAGVSWTATGANPIDGIRQLWMVRGEPQSHLYCVSDQGLLVSADSGDSWTLYLSDALWLVPQTSSSVPVAITRASEPSLTGAGVGQAVVVEETRITAVAGGVRGVAASPRIAGGLYALVQGAGVLQSIDGGSRWDVLGTGLEHADLKSISVSTDYASDLILVGTNEGLFRFE